MGRLVRLFLPAMVAGLIVCAGLGTATLQARDSVLVLPGPALEIGPMLEVAGHPRQEGRGHLHLSSVSIDPSVDIAEWAGGLLGLRGELAPKERIQPHGVSPEEYSRLSRQMLDESTTVATVVALRRAGHAVEMQGRGALVAAVLAGRPADGVLRARDLIVAVDGQPVRTATETGEAVRRRAVGAPVTLTVQREGAAREVTVATAESTLTPGVPTVGVALATESFAANLPFDVRIDAGSLGGPSAGLMFTLGIIDRVGTTDLTRGQRVAGSGTIDLDERVGPIDGVRHKVKGAEAAGAGYFLAAGPNVAEARAAATSLTVVEVNTLQEALDFLATLPPA